MTSSPEMNGSASASLKLNGLSADEAKQRLQDTGPNELPSDGRRGVLRMIGEVVREPMFLLLVIASAVYLAMGDLPDALMLVASVLVMMGITVIQERRTERALDALRDLSAPKARVKRDGRAQVIAGRELVPGDLLLVGEGERIAGDGIVRLATHLSVDESLLTGESAPVLKGPSLEARRLPPPGSDEPWGVYSGTLVVGGGAEVEVTATGAASALGQLGERMAELKDEPTRLEQDTKRLIRLFAAGGVIASAVVTVVFALVRGGGAAAWKEGLLGGIATAISLLPEEFPVVLTVFLALGAFRISRKNVLARRIKAIEALGSATVLCVDKTGTLTENQMRLDSLVVADAEVKLSEVGGALPGRVTELLAIATLASKEDSFDPMDRAVWETQRRFSRADAPGDAPTSGRQLVDELPLTRELLAVRYAWRDSTETRVAAKGAPEAIYELCHLSPAERGKWEQAAAALAKRGLRLLAVAQGDAAQPERPFEAPLTFVGLLGFEDPLRREVPEAVRECQSAGIRVVMITGDSPLTAASIARQAGLDGEEVVTGPRLAELTEGELQELAASTQVFARMVPEQKLRLVQALKARGELVAMTGDGVNDAPALKAADIGIAMGKRGTDVAREAASLVLMDDAFSSIVSAIALGRRIFDNIKKAFAFVLAVHVPIAGIALLPTFIDRGPLLLLPVHIVFVELVIDPACSLVFESEHGEANLMRRPPRPKDETLFSLGMIGPALLQGVFVFLACAVVYFQARSLPSVEATRTATFVALVAGILGLIVVNRSWTQSALATLSEPNPAFRWVLLGTVGLLALVLGVPASRQLFHFVPLPASTLGLSALGGVSGALVFELVKWRSRLKIANQSSP